MFKNINNKIAVLFMAIYVATSIVGCQKNTDSDYSTENRGDGAVVLNITRAEVSNTSLPDDTTLRIYNLSDRLIARYRLDEMPDAIYLAAGSYKATVTIGERCNMSTSADDIYYFGAKEFTVIGGKVSNLDIVCKVQNSVVAVVFDKSVKERFELEAVSYISLSDVFSFEDAKGGVVPTLTMREDGTGYFILPEGVNNISWGFYGESANIDSTTIVASKSIELAGVIENPQAATKYTLKFAYTPTPDGQFGLTVAVDESVEEFNDLFSFSPQPTFEGQGFDIYADGLVFTGDDMMIDVASINDLSKLTISSSKFAAGDVVVMDGGVVNSVAGASLALNNTKSGVLTLSKEFFARFGGYGTQTFRLSATDKMDSEGHEDMSIVTSGVQGSTFDLWRNSGVLTAKVVLDGVESVKFAFKSVKGDTWREVEATKGADNTYTANVEPTWKRSTNSASLTTYTLESGFVAANSYQYKIIVDGQEFAPVTTTTAAGQSIPNGNLNNGGIKAFSTSGSSSGDWASGNNTFSKDLCKQDTKDGRVCALLKSRTAAGVFAAGNLAYGQFGMSGFSGTMSFGQPFKWTVRPQSLRFSYAATVGNETHDDGNRLDGKDVARVYFAIVDWSGRHGVTAGTSGSPSGTWDPTTQSSTDQGKIIGYASVMITESTESFVDMELPIQYYDYTTKPSGAITILISCAASAYGDYMTGSTDSRLWVDDFELGY